MMKRNKKILTILLLAFVTIISNAQEKSEIYYDSGKLKGVGQRDAKGEGIGEWMFYLESGELFAVVNYKYNILHGVYKEYYNSGELHFKMNYNRGKKDGLKKIYYKSGEIKETLKFVDDEQVSLEVDIFGEYEGQEYEHKEYYDSGKLKIDGQYNSNGKHTGTWKKFYESGELEYLLDYVNGKRHGSKIQYFESGKIEHTGTFKDNKSEGIWKFYDERDMLPEFFLQKNGEDLELATGCLSGECENGYGMKYKGGWGPKLFEGNFINGKLNGKGTQLDVLIGTFNFTKDYKGNFQNGVYHGKGTLQIFEVNEAIVTYEGMFKEGKRDGYGIESVPSKGRYEGYWKNDKEHGKAKIFDANNNLLFDCEYENGEIKE